ncbi:MAG: M1 family aminopeptidase [Planctomycetota bacterium]|nr:M1 family aminopeptidase [Planctomycetota bacterium]
MISLAGLASGQPIDRPSIQPTPHAFPAFTHAHDEQPGWAACSCHKADMLRARIERGLPIGEPELPGYSDREAMADTDVISNDIDIEIFPTTEVISGSNTIRVRSLVDGLTQFTYRLRGNFTVQRGLSGNAADTNRVTLNGTTVAVSTTPPTNNATYGRTVTLDRPYNAGEEFTVRIDYTGVAVSRGFGSIEFGTTSAGNPVVATLSEPYYAATWVPVKDGEVTQAGDNIDRATFALAVTAPSNLRTTANGLLESVTPLSGGRTRYRWVTNYTQPTYLAAFCTTVYNTWTVNYSYPLPGGGTGTMPVEFHIYPNSDTPSNRDAWEVCVPMMAAYRPVFGEYPFINEKYGIYQFPFGGGMEHQTNSGQGGFGQSLTAHELVHQWWGDMVTCRTWNDIWLNEGFATYGEALWEERKPGSSGLPALHAAMAARRPSAVGDSVYVYDTSSVNRIFSSNYSYRKGGWVVHMLRKVVGDETFVNILAEHRARFAFSAASTDDFVATASDVAGQDMTRFFQQWVYGIGAPAYASGWQNVAINGQNYLRLRVRQTQDTGWPGLGTPADAFVMPIDVRLDSAQGPSTVTIMNTSRSQHFLIPVASPVSGVTLDEFTWILETGKANEAYVAGPPKVISASPAPGEALDDSPASIVVGFSDNVTVPAPQVTLSGPSGAVPVSVSYNATTWRATITPQGTLAPGAYTLTLGTGITANALALDGEIAGGALPSGNGLAGGAASIAFTVSGGAPCDPDFNADGNVDQDDIACLAQVVAGDPSCSTADPDFNGDGNVDQDDIAALEQVVGGAECP